MNPSCSKNLTLDPHLMASFQKLATGKNPRKSWFYQKYLWEAWFDSVGEKIKPLYSEFVELGNKAAENQGFSDVGKWIKSRTYFFMKKFYFAHQKGEIWRRQYGSLNLERVIDKLWTEIKPLYVLLHGFVRHRLGYSRDFSENPKSFKIFRNFRKSSA